MKASKAPTKAISGKIKVSLSLNRDLVRRAKVVAAQQETSLSAIVEKLLIGHTK